MPRTFSDARLRLTRQAAQLLHRPEALPAVDVVRHLGGIQAQQRGSAPLAIRARSSRPTRADVDRSLHEEGSIVWTWAMRGTLHFVAAEDFPWLLPLVAETQLSGVLRRLAQLGVPPDRAEQAPRLLERALASSGPLTRPELVEVLSRKGIRTEGQAALHLLVLAALRGVICHGPPRGKQKTFVAVRDWVGDGSAGLDRDRAPAELALRYLGAHGPSTPEDFATWSGLRLRDARAAFGAIGDRLEEVRGGGTTMWAIGPRRGDPPRGVVRLLPAFDPYLLGWRTRDLVLPKEHEREIFPGGGMLRRAFAVNGSVAGGWSSERRGDRLEISVRPFSRLSRATTKALAQEIEDVGRFLGTPGVARRSDGLRLERVGD